MRRLKVYISIVIIAISLSFITKSHTADIYYSVSTKHGVLNLTKAEYYVMQKVVDGDVADLIEEFGQDENNRKLRTKFLRFLIIEKLKDKKYDIIIVGAIIDGPFELSSADIDNNIALIYCDFKSYIDLSNTQFKGYLKLDGTQFYGNVYFNSLKINGSLYIDKAIFHRTLELIGANIGEQFSVNSAHFENKDLEINFKDLNVGKDASFKMAEFNGPVDFTKAKFEKDLISDGVKFKSKNLQVKFDGVAIKGYFSLTSAQFYCPASFSGMDIGLGLICDNAIFKNRNPIMFSLLKSKIASFSGASFEGPVDFSLINIEETFIINVTIPENIKRKTIFKNKATFNASSIGKFFIATGAQFDGEASFLGLKVGLSANFDNAVFKGPVNLTSANFGSVGLSFKDAQFLSNDGMVTFDNIKVAGNGIFHNTKFLGPVDFSAADIEGHLLLDGAKFLNKDKYIFFTMMRVGLSAFFDRAVFKGSPSFSGATFKEQVSAQDTRFENNIISVDFSNSRIGHNLNMENSIFKSKPNFENADIGGSLMAKGIKLLKEASFRGLKVGKGVDLNNSIFEELADFEGAHVMENVNLYKAVFRGGVLFRNVDIKGNLQANETSYLNNKLASFNAIKVGCSLFLIKAKFEGPIDFITAHIGSQLHADNAKFLTDDKITFNGINVVDSVFIREAEFKGFVDFGVAQINGNLEANKAKFLNKKGAAEFFNLKVGRSVIINDAEFHGGLNFYGASIGMDLNAEGTKFLGEDHRTSFDNIKIGNEINFIGGVFKSDLLLTYGNISTLRIKGKLDDGKITKSSIKKINLYGTIVEKEFLIKDVDINHFGAKNFQSNGIALFESVDIIKVMDLTNSKFRIFELKNVKLPKKNKAENDMIFLDNFIYEAIYAEKDGKLDNWGELLELLNNSQFNYQNYKRLSNYYEKIGYTDRSSEVIKRGEEIYLNRMPWYQRYPYEYLWGFLTGYGRDIRYSLLSVLLLILIGIGVFHPKYLKKENDARWDWLNTYQYRSYILQKIGNLSIMTRVFISLDQFIPGSPLGLSKSWEISRVCYWQFIYYNLHKILGWILIPLILTALFTRIK